MYKDVRAIFAVYWGAYGGTRALRRSPYLHVAMGCLVLTFPFWTTPLWWDQVISVLPNLLGFTLGGFAMFVGFGDERFKKVLTGVDPPALPGEQSIFVEVCASFVHFLLVQLIALLFAIVVKAWWFYWSSWPAPVRAALPWLNGVAGAVGYGLFLYALTSVLAATMHVFRVSTAYETVLRYIEERSKAQ